MSFGFASEHCSIIFRLKQCNNDARKIHPGYMMNSSLSLLFVVSWGGLLEKKISFDSPWVVRQTCKDSCLFCVLRLQRGMQALLHKDVLRK